MLESSRFTVLDEQFKCSVCGAEIMPLGYTSRDHCSKCLCSIHLDINPGDRQSNCGGVLEPIGAEQGRKGAKIIYKCKKCGMKKKNIAAKDDDNEMIIKLFGTPLT
ncbi:MAG: RNHCP domain-containing protein [Oscillospiraceae bacterium]|jgi:rubredoxin|nr:RNHCP domain-containing protein [Oscillospiraceae bacterium]